jgi:hypothetical protein
MTSRRIAGLSALLAAVALGCGGASASAGFAGKANSAKPTRGPVGDDHSMCEWRGKADREASEVAGPGALQPNVRRVYQLIGTGDDRHKVLICREIDTNFDGVKDVVRRYNEKGESAKEEADTNFDGRLDTWITFAKGHLAEVRLDTDFDGNVDEWKYYSGGKLARVKRDTNHDGKADVWEIYQNGKLERIGVDVDGDERVDRWDHDNEVRRKVEEADRKKEEEAAKAAAAKAAADKAAADKLNEDGPAAPAGKPSTHKRKKKL